MTLVILGVICSVLLYLGEAVFWESSGPGGALSGRGRQPGEGPTAGAATAHPRLLPHPLPFPRTHGRTRELPRDAQIQVMIILTSRHRPKSAS